VQLRYRVAANFSRCAEVIRDALGAFLQPATDDNGIMVDFADDQNRRDNTRCQALEDDRLVVVNRDMGPMMRKRDRIRWRGRVIGL
jgi:hypothetical protein